MASNQLFAGAVEVDITPPIGSGLDGYTAREGSSLGIHDPLLGQLLLFQSGDQRLVLISLDLLGISLEFTNQVRENIFQAIGVPPDHTLIACSHTHSGAAGFLPPHLGDSSSQDPYLMGMVTRKMVGAAIWASHRLQPARLGNGHGRVDGIGLNRNNPHHRPIDNEVIVLRVDDEAGAPIAVLMNFGCHPTVLGYQNRLFSADFPGATRSILRRFYPAAIIMFTNGAAGDVSTRFTRRDQSFSEVERIGRLLAGEALKVMETITTRPDAKLYASAIPVELKIRPFPSLEAAQEELARLQAELEEIKSSGASHGEIRQAVTKVEGAVAQLLVAKEIEGMYSRRSQMQILTISDLALVGFPGEPFTQTVLDIKASSPSPHTAIIGYANDYQGYFPDTASIEDGSYEVLISPYGADVATTLQELALILLRGKEDV